MGRAHESLEKTIEMLRTDRGFRIGLTTRSHQWFFMTYFRDHVTYPLADFHKELFRLTEGPQPLVTAVAFRSSGKSTILSLSFPIWAALSGRKKFILIVSKTEAQVKQIMYNIKAELETNPYLASDFGPFNAGDVWNELSLVIAGSRARIVGVSVEHSLRGLKHLASRPDLVILDDVEDMESVRSGEVRDKRYRWFKSEVIPAGAESCQIWVVGNLLHEDSLVSRLRQEIERKEIDGIYRQYPIVVGGVPTWPGRFRSIADVDALRMKVGDERAFKREYLLEITAEADQVVLPEWVRYHDGKLPGFDGEPMPKNWEFEFIATGVDLAISEREAADYTAMVTAAVYREYRQDERGNRWTRNFYIYVLPVVTRAHLSFHSIIERAKVTDQLFPGHGTHHFFVEDVAFQRAVIDALSAAHLFVKGVKTDGMDKRSRLMIAARAMETGRVFFPKRGCEDLIREIVGFGAERHDDLADAFSTLVRQAEYEVNHHAMIVFL